MMPPTEIKTVTVLRESRGSFKDNHPNAVLFQPHCAFNNSKPIVRVHFDPSPKKARPQSAKVQYVRPSPPPQKKRPQSAKVYSEPRFEVPIRKRRPTSAVSAKSASTDISDIISELSRNLDEISVEVQKPRMKKRIWRPKKKSVGIHHTPAPPPPIRAKWSNDRSPAEIKEEGKPHRRQNDLAWVRPYKYKTQFHSYDKFSRNQMEILHRTGKPDFVKKFPVYGHSAAKQRCCYRPSMSVTRVDHHHRVESVSLPHPALREVETPTPRMAYIPFDADQGQEEGQEEEGGEEEEQSETNNNGSFAFTYEGDVKKNFDYDSEEETGDRYRTSGTEQTTGRSTDYTTSYRDNDNSANDDLYFLSSRQNDSNKNNNKPSDVSHTEIASLNGTFTRNDLKNDKSDNDFHSVTRSDPEDENTYDVSDIDDELYDDIPEIPSDIEDALDRYKPRKSNRPQSANKYRSRTDGSESDAKQVDSD